MNTASEMPRREGGHFFIGNLLEFRNERIEMLLDVARKKQDITDVPMGPLRRIVSVCSPAIANDVLMTQASSFVKSRGLTVFLKPVLGNGLLSSERSLHERQRRLLAPAFHPKRVAAYATTMGERAAKFAAKLEGNVDLSDALMHLTFDIVGKTLFDAEVQGDAAAVGEALTTGMEVAMGQLSAFIPLPPWIPSPQNRRLARAVEQLDDVVYRVIRERRKEGGDRGDVLSVLLSAQDDDGTTMTDKQVRDEAMTLFLAGHETTANALTWTFDLLARNPDVREKLEAELQALDHDVPTYEDLKKLPYTLAVFKEAMRLYPPAYLLARMNVDDVVLGGHLVKKGAIVAVNVLGIHRRPDLWPDPDRFDPERFLGERERQIPKGAYLPFGGGPRVCIGNHFATMEGQLLLATIAKKVRFELASKAPTPIEPLVTLRPKGGLKVKAVKR